MQQPSRAIFTLFLVVVLATIACGSTSQVSPPPASSPQPAEAGGEETTAPPPASSTPKPTNTPRPTATPTEVPEPISLSGTGDSVVEIDKWPGPAILHIIYNGGRNFIIENFDANGEQIDLLVNTIGAYDGTIPLDFLDDQATTRFQVQASGDWTIDVLPLSEVRRETVPGTVEGNGDEVLLLEGATPDLLKIDASNADSNFIIWGYGDDYDLLVNEIAPYTGTVIVPSGIFVFAVKAEGPWSMEVTSR